ncbi:MAG: hypothetical protein HOB79_01735 [Rhodospirillaceae bacterium]|jgi:hypothetical protein|nr:hypothetical protein [Rhodospirillales bacterium]MBT3905447.1 hypothetical protein [Rhodospirillaceae bacterium]MBT4699770.1 hypothetical protein [Rhodospirillaceae bacterium]MBT5034645.1 hypothetical protein [Rhodospirillaceae bacterium]MBT6220489.1 hypothetical protein [Rhodospirillaceae bacterium]
MRGLITTLFVGLFLATAALPSQANAQTTCFDRAKFTKELEVQHAESPIPMGLANTGMMVEIFASTNVTFTILLTQPDGTSCFVAAGDYWENSPKQVVGLGS